MAQVTVQLPSGQTVTVNETTPGLFGSLGYTYVNGAPNTTTPAPATTTPTNTTTTNNSGGGASAQGSTVPSGFPNVALEPGMNSPEVKQLQQWLIQQGYSIPDGATGYYGPQTKAAVTALQKKLGVNTEGNDGYWGPRTISGINSNPNGVVNTTTPPATTTPPVSTAPIPVSNQEQLEYYKSLGYVIKSDPSGNGALAYPPGTPVDPAKPVDPNAPKTTTDTSWLINDPTFKSLPKDMQDFLTQYYSTITSGSAEKQKTLMAALETAKGQANPYYAEIVRIAKSELERQLGVQQTDANAGIQTLTESINNIKQDLASGRGDLTVEEQAELKRQQAKYEIELETLKDEAASTGLTFSSKRALAETRLSNTNTDIVESTQRKYARDMRDLELRASRGETEAIQKIDEIKRKLKDNSDTLVRGTETKIGTAELPTNINGATPIGGVTGTLADDKLKDIMQRAEGLASLTNNF